jgi:proline dehydrogenase
MTLPFKARLRDARYALPGLIEKHVAGETPELAARSCARLARTGVAVTAGYFHGGEAPPAQVAETWTRLASGLAESGCNAVLALKAPALGFDTGLVLSIAAAGVPLVFDSLTEPLAGQTLELAEACSAGVALPARWQRSAADAARLRNGHCRIRLVKGEWTDPVTDAADPAAAYLDLVRTLAGRPSTVGVATHDPLLAEEALRILLAAGTPCELEQLRGLPRLRTMAVAKKLGVRVRLYYAFGPGWWPYALDKALARPYLPLWALRDFLGS